jgi:uncharacterized RDD family membrane protein YckC
MKCPKCSYLGFETGDRCKNCGYDFSLLMREPETARTGQNWMDLIGGSPETASAAPAVPVAAPDPLAPMPLDTVVAAPVATTAATAPSATRAVEPVRAAPPRAVAPALPLFHPASPGDDEPLIKVPAAPRRPLSVRRTPQKPRSPSVAAHEVPLHATYEVESTRSSPPAVEDPLAAVTLIGREEPLAPIDKTADVEEATSGPGRRLAAAVIDHAILFAIDLVVIYFTVKMAGLTIAEWTWLPPVPLVAFLGLMKAAYFYTFTLLGGQTIGKMALQIRVVTDERGELDAPRAVQRTLIGFLSLLVFGLGLAPLLFSSDRRALHDHVARTKVVRN